VNLGTEGVIYHAPEGVPYSFRCNPFPY
jgi:hypothetical protein